MSDQVMVIVSDLDNANHGEINVVQSTAKAGTLVETLLEAGFEKARIRVFAGGQMNMRVRQRPVVTFVAEDEISGSELDDDVDTLTVSSDTDADSPEDQVAAAPYQQNGVRFVNAFRPA